MSAGARLLAGLVAAALAIALLAWLRIGGEAASAGAVPSETDGAAPALVVTHQNERAAAAPESAIEVSTPVESSPAAAPEPPGTAELSGWLHVGGAPPPEAIELTLVRAADGPGEPRKEVQRTAPDGGFRFAGLAPGWRGVLRLPPGWAAEPPGDKRIRTNSWSFDAPATGLSLEVFAVRSLRGRVVDCASGAPVPGAIAAVFLHGAGKSGYSTRARCGDDGRFVLPLPPGEFREVTWTAQSADGGRARDTVFEWAELPPSLDVGDLCLAAPRDLAFRVVDAAGAPVPHAMGRLLESRVHARADERGEGELRGLPPGELALRFAADGFRAADRTALAGQQELLVQLERGNRLVVQLAGEDIALDQVLVELHALEPLFPETGGWDFDHVLREASGSQLYMGSSGPGDAARIYADLDGRVEVQAVASVPIHLRVLDALLEPLADQGMAPLGPQELREVRVELPADLGAVRGRVLDPSGAPLAQVQVSARASDAGHQGFAHSDDAGRFVVGPIARERVDVQLRRDGYAEVLLRGVPTRGPELEVRLQPGHALEVQVRDPAGAPVPAEQVVALSLGADAPRWRAVERPRGTYWLADLPDEPLRVRAIVGGRGYEREHHPLDGPLHLEVPHHGALEVRWKLPPGRSTPRVRVTSPADPELELDWWAEAPEFKMAAIPALLPGTYDLELQAWDAATETRVAASARQRVEVEAGRTARVELAP